MEFTPAAPLPPPHLVYQDIVPETVIGAVRDLFGSDPWNAAGETARELFNRAADRICAAYHVPAATVVFTDVNGYDRATGTIVLGKVSVMTFLTLMRVHLITHDAIAVIRHPVDTVLWAQSVFYAADPQRFRKMAAAGRIVGASTETLMDGDTFAWRAAAAWN